MSKLRPPQHSTEGEKGHMQSSQSSTKTQKSKPRSPGQGEIPETKVNAEIPDGFTLPQIIAHYKKESKEEPTEIVEPTSARMQAIAAMKGQMLRHVQETNAGVAPIGAIAAQREDLGSAGYTSEDSTRGLAVRSVLAAKPVLMRDEAAVMIQSHARGCIARRRILKEVEAVANHAALRLQRLFRRARKRREAAAVA
jgi:hypothetical protein